MDEKKWYLVQWLKEKKTLYSFEILEMKSFIAGWRRWRPREREIGTKVLAYRKKTSSIQPAKIIEISENFEYIIRKWKQTIMATKEFKKLYFDRMQHNLKLNSHRTVIKFDVGEAKHERPYGCSGTKNHLKLRYKVPANLLKEHLRSFLNTKNTARLHSYWSQKLMAQQQPNSSCQLQNDQLNNNFKSVLDLPRQLNIDKDDDALASTSQAFSSVTLTSNTEGSQPTLSVTDSSNAFTSPTLTPNTEGSQPTPSVTDSTSKAFTSLTLTLITNRTTTPILTSMMEKKTKCKTLDNYDRSRLLLLQTITDQEIFIDIENREL